MSDQRETLLELQRLLKSRDVDKAYQNELVEEKRIYINKVRRIKERLINLKEEISRKESSIKHFLDLLNKVTETEIDNEKFKDLMKKVCEHEYVTKVLDQSEEGETQI